MKRRQVWNRPVGEGGLVVDQDKPQRAPRSPGRARLRTRFAPPSEPDTTHTPARCGAAPHRTARHNSSTPRAWPPMFQQCPPGLVIGAPEASTDGIP
ncbi:MAG: hypothetical protein ACRDRD_17670, partial [Pseudonocardiaceae bacterium]